MDPDLILRWQLGWTRCRGLPAATESDNALHVVLGLTGRHTEMVALGDGDGLVADLSTKAAAASEPTWLTVMTTRPSEVAEVMRSRGLSAGPPEETFMTADLVGGRPVDPAVRVRVTPGDSTVRVEILDASGITMARGMIGLTGSDAVAHDVFTAPRHRGQGLARTVMGLLADEALARGAEFGLLVASEAGRRLYERLGWTARADVVVGRR